MARAERMLGELSYPLYVLHLPIFAWLAAVVFAMHLRTAAAVGPVIVAACFTAIILSWLLLVAVDRPSRRVLSAWRSAGFSLAPSAIAASPEVGA
jgi:peptidoglycan/LPS O-acetylase OafA/YrhL